MTFRTETLAEGVTCILGDCREVLPTLGRFDACVTDPPYGIGIAANPVRQKFERSNWDDAPPTADVFDLIRSVSEMQIIWGGNYFALPPSQGFLIWDKKQPHDFSLAMCEMAWWSKQQPAKMWRQSVLSYDKEHPTQKPVPLMFWCLQQMPDAKTILDPFCGSGTTGVAAVKLGRNFTGIEIDPHHFETSLRRISEALRQPDMFIEKPKPAKQEAML